MATEPKDFYWIRTANLAQLRTGLIKAIEQGNEELSEKIRAQMANINKAKPKKSKTLLTVGT